jgi:hypothetical protein
MNYERVLEFPSTLIPVRKANREILVNTNEIAPLSKETSSNASSSKSPSTAPVSELLLQQLLAFDIPKKIAAQALQATNNTGLQEALDFAFSLDSQAAPVDDQQSSAQVSSTPLPGSRSLEIEYFENEVELSFSNLSYFTPINLRG